MRDCDAEGSLTDCVEGHMDSAHPGCTREDVANSDCESKELGRRLKQTHALRYLDYKTFANTTGCRKTCVQK